MGKAKKQCAFPLQKLPKAQEQIPPESDNDGKPKNSKIT